MPADASPDSKCPICLDKFDNIAYLGYCWHRFCFRCIQEWSKTKAECPLCKQPFFSIFHTIRAEDDFQEYTVTPSGEAALSSPEGSTTSSAESPFSVRIYDLHGNYDYLTPSDDEGSGSDSAVTAETPGSEDSSSVSDVSQASWDDETPGPIFFTLEDYGATSASPWEFSESPDEDSAWERTMLQPQLPAGGDSSDSDSSSEYYHSTTCLNLYTEGTAELTELSSDSEESIREEKREDAKSEQSVQGHSWSDSELSSSSSPCSSLYKENVSSCQ
ncbi:E3 ubiquitin-protein ligase Topors-like, partial [Numida meleagris]|uniref:E3 ubiquitin-protein ligase Topors-like n=1 Tax=Numida meleagris TaxID=8996 RepID=UPI000B3D8185